MGLLRWLGVCALILGFWVLLFAAVANPDLLVAYAIVGVIVWGAAGDRLSRWYEQNIKPPT